MRKVIVTTTINPPTEAIERFDAMQDWELVVSGDNKTPKDYKLKRGKYLDISEQESLDRQLSNLIGWNCIQRRNMAALYALTEMKADVVAYVDDDNIPCKDWGKNLRLGTMSALTYETDELVFDPLTVTNHPKLWHRGFPIQRVHERSKLASSLKVNTFDVQADLWDGDPDVDAVCRLSMAPNVTFSVTEPYTSTATFSPFNSQNTFLTKAAAKHFVMVSGVGRMDDIWACYYVQARGFKPVYCPASVTQLRNVHDLVKDLEGEMQGYKFTGALLEALSTDPDALCRFVPICSWQAIKRFEELVDKA